MEMNGEQRIPASREVVWAALNDPDVLKACIPGCQELVKSSETNMTAVAVIKVGPVSAKFQGAVTLSDLDPPNGYRITGEGQGGVAGFAKGSAVVRLEEQEGETLLCYQVSADIGGKLAQLGGRLIDATARKMSDAFFKKFSGEIQQRASARSTTDTPTSSTSPAAVKPAVPQHETMRPQHAAAVYRTAPSAPGPDRLTQTLLAILLIGLVALAVFFVTGRTSSAIEPTLTGSLELVATALLLVVAAVGYLLGRASSGRSAADVQMDSTSFRELVHAMRESDRPS